jgi:hypothetical protein
MFSRAVTCGSSDGASGIMLVHVGLSKVGTKVTRGAQ